MKDYKLSRRALLARLGRGATGAALLPLLDAHRVGAAPVYPRRLFAMAYPNGVIAAQWFPRADFSLPLSTEPFEPYKKDMIFTNLRLSSFKDFHPPNGGHVAWSMLLTGKGARGGSEKETHPIGGDVSVDQYIAGVYAQRAPTPLHSLVLSCQNRESKKEYKYLCFKGPPVGTTPQAADHEEDPFRVYNKIFLGRDRSVKDDPALARLVAERRSVLDVVRGDLEALGKLLGLDDRTKLHSHLEAVRGLEKQLSELGAGVPGPAAACGNNPEPGAFAHADPLNYEKALQLNIDLAHAALACGLTRTVALQASNGHGNAVVFYWLGAEFTVASNYFNTKRNHHEIAHNTFGDQKAKVDRWYSSMFARMIKRMKETPEAGGTMLDNSVAVLLNNMDHGGSHTTENVPVALAGSCGGYFKTGRHIRLTARAHNGLLVSLANAMLAGVTPPLKHFNGEKYGGEISELRA